MVGDIGKREHRYRASRLVQIIEYQVRRVLSNIYLGGTQIEGFKLLMTSRNGCGKRKGQDRSKAKDEVNEVHDETTARGQFMKTQSTIPLTEIV